MNSISQLFRKSSLTEENRFISTAGILDWVQERRDSTAVRIEKTAFDKLDKWLFDDELGTLRHETGQFFSIDGIRVRTNYGTVPEWTQPIINQPEVGYLGIIAREIDGILYFLMQAKVEPGNIDRVQVSPTLQATKSNYTQVHKGKGQEFLKYFLDRRRNRVLFDQLQSEQGARFLKKRNRNIIILVNEDVPHDENYQWMTLRQIKLLLMHNNIVNMDTRTVVSGIPYGECYGDVDEALSELTDNGLSADTFGRQMLKSMLDPRTAADSFDELLAWFTDIKQQYDLEVSRVPLNELEFWSITHDGIVHIDGKYFRVIPVDISVEGREVEKWCQPMIQPCAGGLIAFIVREFHGVMHFLVQAKLECGNFDVMEFAPTVQCLTGRIVDPASVPYLQYVLNAHPSQIRYDQFLSEEGGRFYREQNRNIIVEADDTFPGELPATYRWLTLNQLATFLKFNNYLNIQARSLLSAVVFN
ncbi:MAG: NDP-hexose 2,3-dehydratase family protein [Planctomycetes bacterium]|nr:NDP-hexose 2,3-dehydratase family protein [Planctomycetota bacterium]